MHGRSEPFLTLAQRVFGVTPHAALPADRCGDVVEVAMEFADFVVTATGRLNRLRRIRFERSSRGKLPHRIVQTFDAARDQRVQADTKTHDGEKDRDGTHAELAQQSLPVDCLRQAEIVDEENQRATRGAQLPWTDRHRRRQDEGQEVAIEAEQALGPSFASHAPHRLFDTRILVGGKIERGQIELAPNPVATTAEHDLVVGSDEDRRANLLEDGKLTKLALRSLELTALGGPFRSTLDL